jgi:hypothetical protein
MFVMSRRFGEGVAEFRRALSLMPPTTSYMVRNDLAGALLRADDLSACLAEAAELEKMKPGSAEACNWRVRVLHARGNADEASGELARGLARDPSNALLLSIGRELGYGAK